MSNSLTLLLNIRSQCDPEALPKDLAVATRDSAMLRFLLSMTSALLCDVPRCSFVKMRALRMFLYRLENLSRQIAGILIEVEKLCRELWTDPFVFMLEENIGVVPRL
jgi:hypothetical protein